MKRIVPLVVLTLALAPSTIASAASNGLAGKTPAQILQAGVSASEHAKSFSFDGKTTQGKLSGDVRGQWTGTRAFMTLNFPGYKLKGTLVFEPGKVYVKGTAVFVGSELGASSQTSLTTLNRWANEWIAVSPRDRVYQKLRSMMKGAQIVTGGIPVKNVVLSGKKTVRGTACDVVTGLDGQGNTTTNYVALKAPHVILGGTVVARKNNPGSTPGSTVVTFTHYGAKYHGPAVSHATAVSQTPFK